ncbi:MAG: SRPBCC family protein [Kovacikia sp.]
MAEYKFVTRWHIAAPIEQVWDAIVHSEDWAQWWKAVASVEELETGEADGIGNIHRLVWKTPLKYTRRC